MRRSLRQEGIKLGLQEQSQVWANLAGGARRGIAYVGLTTASLDLNLEKLAGWTGTKVFVNALQIHGSGPSVNLVGNLQIVSNVEATRDTKLYQFWIEQALFNGRLTIRLGQEGANDQMMTSRYAALFLNSGFGFPSLAAVDLPSGGPNYPLAAPFVRAEFQASDHVTLVGAAFSGDPAAPGVGDPQLRDRGGSAFRLNDHLLAFGEFWYSTTIGDGVNGLAGTYKLGAWYHSGHFADQWRDTNGVSLASAASNGVARDHASDFAVYGIVDQMIWKKPGTAQQGIGVFLLAIGAPGDSNLSNLFVAAGMNWSGPFEARENDVFGIGVSYLGISPGKRRFGRDAVAFSGQGTAYWPNETVIEATYLFQVTPWWTLQPDLQFVINPGAGIMTGFGGQPLKNAVSVGVQTMITF